MAAVPRKGLLLKKLPLPSSAPELPVVKPSEQEFEDLEALLRSQGHLGAQHGAIKVVPPLGYKARETYEGYDTLLRCCASQTAEGDHGLYELRLEEAGSMYLSDLEGIIAETEEGGEMQWSSDVKTAEIEFWRNIGIGDSSTVYTAQSVNSTLFDKSTRLWNLHAMRQKVPRRLPVCLRRKRLAVGDMSTAPPLLALCKHIGLSMIAWACSHM